MKKFAYVAVSAFVWAVAAAPLAHAAPPQGPNSIEGTVGEGPAGVAACTKATVYLYEALPEISPADGGARTPVFVKPSPSDEHWETPCAPRGFSFKNIPDGSYLAGVPTAGLGPALASMVTVDGGKTATVTLTFQQPGR